MESQYECYLEKRPRARGISKIISHSRWELRLFVIKGQELSYFADKQWNSLKGTIDLRELVSVEKLSEGETGKPFAFVCITKSDRLALSASSEEVRSICMKYFLAAQKSPYWKEETSNPMNMAPVRAKIPTSTDKEDVVALESKPFTVSMRFASEINQVEVLKSEIASIHGQENKGALRQRLAAMLIQSAWRAHRFYVEMMVAKRKRELAAAVRIQSRGRTFLAQHKLDQLRLYQRRSKAAIIIQSRFRIYVARRLLTILRKNRQRFLNACATRLQSISRRCAAQWKLLNLRKTLSDNLFIVRVLKTPNEILAKSSNAAGSVNLHITAVGSSTSATSSKSASPISRASSGKVVSSRQEKVVPTNDSLSFVGGIDGNGFIVLTFVDKNDCLGQCVVDISEHPQLYRGKEITLTLPLHDYAVKVINDSKRQLVSSLSKSSSGPLNFTISVTLADKAMNTCSFLAKMSDKFMSSHAYKRRFVVVYARSLLIYDDALALHEPAKHATGCAAVTALTLASEPGSGAKASTSSSEPALGDDVLSVVFRSLLATGAAEGPSVTWKLKFEVPAGAAAQERFMSVLHRNCIGVPDPLLVTLGIPRVIRTAALSPQSPLGNQQQQQQAASAVADVLVGQSKARAKKRISIFS